ncbi:MAG: hypothetical protein JWM11_960 [Planctomycetaceae bacterium]|nr:hypothetical protein [Planctomycetaceae bacterium]
MQSCNEIESDRRSVFTDIYSRNAWGGQESRSGTGSDYSSTGTLVDTLPWILKVLNITQLLDAPCGDFHWMKEVVQAMQADLPAFTYHGVDIVAEALVAANQVATDRNLSENCHWMPADLVDEVPQVGAELILIRDLLGHLPLRDVERILENVKVSGAKWLMTTHFPNAVMHDQISAGQWQPINLTLAPFHWPRPAFVINENSPESKAKSLGLWRLSQ